MLGLTLVVWLAGSAHGSSVLKAIKTQAEALLPFSIEKLTGGSTDSAEASDALVGPVQSMEPSIGFPSTDESELKQTIAVFRRLSKPDHDPRPPPEMDTDENAMPIGGSFSVCSCENEVDRPAKMDYGAYYYDYYQKLRRCAVENCAVCMLYLEEYISQTYLRDLSSEQLAFRESLDAASEKEWGHQVFCQRLNEGKPGKPGTGFRGQIDYEKCVTLTRQFEVYADPQIRTLQEHELLVASYRNDELAKEKGDGDTDVGVDAPPAIKTERLQALVKQQTNNKVCHILGCCG
eukprot:c53771_g1_i1.p1 GENE.c53771_g1_i1~~c53771_g1_i1.p1  ORF type:complete len:291 (+),score=43.57 c53771_g1_i1:31-903(+)